MFFRLNYKKEEIETILRNKVIVIIGASSGIGQELTELCKKSQAKVYPCSRSLNNVDITSEKNLITALERIKKEAGRIRLYH